jgi:hypothetical protein
MLLVFAFFSSSSLITSLRLFRWRALCPDLYIDLLRHLQIKIYGLFQYGNPFTSEIVNPFRRFLGLLLRGSARSKTSTYTGLHATE